MKKIITAIGNPILNEKLKLEKNIEVMGNDIQYQEGIFEILEKEESIDFLILSEMISGEFSTEKLIEKIMLINKKIKIIIILENNKEELENKLALKGIFKIIYHNKIEIKDIVKIINIENKNNNENQELKQEILDLKKLIIENKINNQNLNEQLNKNKLNDKEKLISLINNFFQKINIFNSNKIVKNKENLNFKSEIISISGPSGVGKSIISINLAKSMMYRKEKILLIDFDILNNNLHTILGVKKYPKQVQNKLKKDYYQNVDNLKNNNFTVDNFIIKINKKIDLMSGVDLLFGTKEKINLIKIEKTLNILKEKYKTIIIDTSSECFFDFTKTIIKISNKNIFVTETNILEIKKSKELLDIYINEWKIDKNKFNILFNKYDKNCTNINILKSIFCEFNIIGILNYNSKYNKLINKNIKSNFNDKKIRKEYLKINNNI